MTLPDTPDPFDFETVIPRRGSDCTKWNVPEGTIPMSIADMDYPPPPPVLDALRRRLDHGVLGYADPPADALEAIVEAMAGQYDWAIEPDWIHFMPGVVPMLQYAARLLAPDEAAVTFTPIYPPFLYPTVHSGRPLIRVPLAAGAGGYEVDYDALEAAVRGRRGGLMMWCHPQNPTGRCFDRAELERLADFCLARGWLIASDEIHCGLILDENRRHIPLARLSPEIAARTLTFMAPSKTYNIPGLCTAFAIISDPALRRSFKECDAGRMPLVNIFGYAACTAAYRHGEPWRRALIRHLRANRDRLAEAVADMPGLSMHAPQATYLAWVDCREAGLDHPATFFRRAGLAFFDGRAFDAPGFIRINFGCPRATLDEAIGRMKRALDTRS
jgi:cysteine-S-conjugate beta-lyase